MWTRRDIAAARAEFVGLYWELQDAEEEVQRLRQVLKDVRQCLVSGDIAAAMSLIDQNLPEGGDDDAAELADVASGDD